MSGAAAALSYLGAIAIHPALQTRLRAPRVGRASSAVSIEFHGNRSNFLYVPHYAPQMPITNEKKHSGKTAVLYL